MERLFVILFFVASVSGFILFKKFPANTGQGIVVQFCWFVIMMTLSFIFLSEHSTISQNLALGTLSLGGLIYFFYKFKTFRKETNH